MGLTPVRLRWQTRRAVKHFTLTAPSTVKLRSTTFSFDCCQRNNLERERERESVCLLALHEEIDRSVVAAIDKFGYNSGFFFFLEVSVYRHRLLQTIKKKQKKRREGGGGGRRRRRRRRRRGRREEVDARFEQKLSKLIIQGYCSCSSLRFE